MFAGHEAARAEPRSWPTPGALTSPSDIERLSMLCRDASEAAQALSEARIRLTEAQQTHEEEAKRYQSIASKLVEALQAQTGASITPYIPEA